MQTIKIKELKEMAFVNSDKLRGNRYVIDDIVHKWIGIGFVECKEKPNESIHIFVINGEKK